MALPLIQFFWLTIGFLAAPRVEHLLLRSFRSWTNTHVSFGSARCRRRAALVPCGESKSSLIEAGKLLIVTLRSLASPSVQIPVRARLLRVGRGYPGDLELGPPTGAFLSSDREVDVGVLGLDHLSFVSLIRRKPGFSRVMAIPALYRATYVRTMPACSSSAPSGDFF
jgi:hypothetical protein